MIFESVRTIFGDLFEGIAEFFIRKGASVGEEFAKIRKYLLDCLNIFLGAVDEQFIAASADTDIEQGFEELNILVLNAE